MLRCYVVGNYRLDNNISNSEKFNYLKNIVPIRDNWII